MSQRWRHYAPFKEQLVGEPDEAIDTRSKECRDLLKAVQNDTRHKVVRTDAISTEWHQHQSRFTRIWLSSMYAKRRVCKINAPADDQLRREIERCAISEKKRDAMLKDIHLIEAALQADKIVLSMDETVRHSFKEVTYKIQLLAFIAWINPCINGETPIEWLQSGAKLEKKRLLGYREGK